MKVKIKLWRVLRCQQRHFFREKLKNLGVRWTRVGTGFQDFSNPTGGRTLPLAVTRCLMTSLRHSSMLIHGYISIWSSSYPVMHLEPNFEKEGTICFVGDKWHAMHINNVPFHAKISTPSNLAKNFLKNFSEPMETIKSQIIKCEILCQKSFSIVGSHQAFNFLVWNIFKNHYRSSSLKFSSVRSSNLKIFWNS